MNKLFKFNLVIEIYYLFVFYSYIKMDIHSQCIKKTQII